VKYRSGPCSADGEHQAYWRNQLGGQVCDWRAFRYPVNCFYLLPATAGGQSDQGGAL